MADSAGDLYVTAKIDASNLADDLASQTESKAEKSGVTLGGLVGKGLKVGATAAAGGIAAVLTGAFVKGFTRLTSIDQAKAKLEGLGYTGNTLKDVMNNALNSVKGTAFGLDEAVGAVPGLLAAGVKPGKDLEQALKNMASAATLGGTSFAEVSDVFGDAAAAGAVTTDVFNRMAARGIPALQMVADSLGVTREEAAKMTTEGKISFQQFQDALTAGIGPAALAAGDSFQGMLANIMAALGRFGAEILGPVFEGLKSVMPSVIAAFDALTAVMKPIMAEIGPKVAEAFEKIKTALDGVDWSAVAANIANIVKVFIDWAPAIWAVVGAFVAFKVIQGVNAAIATTTKVIKAAQLAMLAYRSGIGITTAIQAGLQAANLATAASVWASTVAFLASPVTWIVIGIMALIAAIILLALNWDKVTKFLTDVWNGFIEWFQGVMDGFLSWWDGVWSGFSTFVSEAIDNVVSWVQDNWGLLLSILIGPIGLAIQWIVENWGAIAQFFADVWTNVVAFLQPAIDVIANIFRVLGETISNIWLVIRAVALVIWTAILLAVTPIIQAISDFITTVFTALSDWWTEVWTAISDFFIGVWEGIVAFITPIVESIASFIEDTITNVRVAWELVWGAISDYFEQIWGQIVNFIVPIVLRVKAAIEGPIKVIQGIWNGVWSAVSSFFTTTWTNIVSAVQTAVSTVIAVITGIKDKVMGAVSGAIGWLVGVGKDIIQGLINGIKSMINAVKTAVSDTVNGVINWAKGILGEHSPSKVFDKIGVDLGRGFVNGIDSMASDVQASVGNMTLGAVDVAGATITALPGQGTGGSTTTNSSQFTIEPGAIQVSGDDPYKTSLLVLDRIAEKVAI
jgi:tape measure domain-containing protein